MSIISCLFAVSVLLFACGGEDTTTPSPDSGGGRDGGPIVRDGGPGPRDGGEITPDGGEATPDGGEVTPDGGEIGPDGGEVTPDGGEATPDGGPAMQDGGSSGGRTIVTEHCARRFGSCSTDSDCTAGGCGGELCASEELFTTCDCTAPTASSCGCVDGTCAWYR